MKLSMFKFGEADKRVVKFYVGVRANTYKVLVSNIILFTILYIILELPIRGEMSILQSIIKSTKKELFIGFTLWIFFSLIDLVFTCIYTSYFYIHGDKVDFSAELILPEVGNVSEVYKVCRRWEKRSVLYWSKKAEKKSRKVEKRNMRKDK